jgi:molybdopterin molybdotransferase
MMIEPDEALARVLDLVKPLPAVQVPLAEAAGYILAESIRADRDYPPFDRAMMDGAAVRLADAGRTVEVRGEVAAGDRAALSVVPGTCLNIMTGAPCPEGTEAVVPEEALLRRGALVTLPGEIPHGANIVSRGAECRKDSLTLEEGDTVTALAAGVLASLGRERVRIIAPPEVALIITGKEVVRGDSRPGPAEIRDANGPMLEALVSASGATVSMRLHAEDTPESLARMLERASGSDLVLLSGGVSAGKFDLVPGELERFGAEILFRKVRQKPGKPLLFARRGEQVIFGLPGNPLAVHFCFHRYASAALRKMMGKQPSGSTMKGVLAEAVSGGGQRHWFMPGAARWIDGVWRIRPIAPRSTADLFNAHRANCYVHIPQGESTLLPGTEVQFEISA